MLLANENIQAVCSSGSNSYFGEILNLKGDTHLKLSFYVENSGRPESFLEVMRGLNNIPLV